MESKILSGLYQKLSGQGDTIILDNGTVGTGLTAQWASLLKTDAFHLTRASLSDPDDKGNFTASGTLGFLSFGVLTLHFDFFIAFDDPPQSKETLQVVIRPDARLHLWQINSDFADMPGYVDYSVEKISQGLQSSFLNLIEFKDITFRFSSFDFSGKGAAPDATSYAGGKTIDGEAMKQGINFGATIDTDGAFWKTVLSITGDLGTLSIFTHIMDDGGTVSLEAGCHIDAVFTISDSLKVRVTELVLRSGLNASSKISPTFSLICEVQGIDPALELEIDTGINRPWIRLEGFFKDKRVFTLSQMASALGMEGLDIGKLLPEKTGESYFGELGLKDFSLEMTLSPARVDQLAFTIATEHPWVIVNNIITLQPYMSVSVSQPFVKDKREACLEILGRWMLGTTPFYIFALPLSGEVSAAMEESHTLDVTSLTEKLLPGITLPEIELEKMVLTANYLTNTYHVQLAASAGLSFELGHCSFGITNVGLSCVKGPEGLQDLNINGTLCLAGLIFDVEGDYNPTRKWILNGGIRTAATINFKACYNALVSDLGIAGAELPATVPADYLSVEIGGMFIDYASKDKDLVAYVDLLHPFPLSRNFSIDEVAIKLHFTAKGIQDALVKMKLTLVSVDIILSLAYDKAKKSWSFKGGTQQGQKIPIGKIAEDLIHKFDAAVNIPKSIEGLVVDSIQISVDTTGPDREVAFLCQGSMPIENKELDLSVGLNFTKKEGKYQFDIEGKVHIGHINFVIDFEHTETQNVLAALALEDPPLKIVLRDVIARLSEDAAQIIPPSLEISLKDAFFILAGETEKQNKGGLNILFGIDIGESCDISTLPVIGGLFAQGTTIGLDDLQAVVSTKPVSPALYKTLQTVLKKSKTCLQPDSLPDTGLYLSAILNLVEIKPKLTLPIVKKAQKEALPPNALACADTNGSGLQKIHWNKVNKTLGPIQLRRVGVGLQSREDHGKKESRLTFAIDVSLKTSGFELDLIGLWIGVDISKPFSSLPAFGLHGIDVAYSQPPIEFNGGLLYVEPVGPGYSWEINGQLMFKYGEYGFFGVGSYAEPDKSNWPFDKEIYPILPSFFAFLMVSAPIGGPPYIYLSGLAGGFGFNRNLKIPRADQLLSFPLVQGAMEPADFNAGQKADTALTAMGKWVPPAPDDFWLAVGVSVGSCHIINAYVMVAGVFGTDFELAVIGLATADIPTEESGVLLAHLELALVGNFNPMHPSVEITGALTSTSYLFCPQCRLTGGFAYCMWLDKGNFLVSIGGYSPAFKKPDYYPVLEHVGINWKISDHLVLKGGAYYAYTPSCAMAGGELKLDFNLGIVHAWLTAHADFLLEWLPFHYDISIGVSIGVSVRIHIWFIHKTITLEVGADLHLWGPAFSGQASVHLWIVSFTIGFGANANKKPPRLTWDQFYDALLSGGGKQKTNAPGSASDPPSVTTVLVQKGLNKGIRKQGSPDHWIVNGDDFVFETKSQVPATQVSFNDTALSTDGGTTQFGIRPMGESEMSAHHRVWFEQKDKKGNWSAIGQEKVENKLSLGNLPEANWADSALHSPGAGTVDNVPVGITITSVPPACYTLPAEGEIDTRVFMYEALNLDFDWGSTTPPKNKDFKGDPMTELKTSIMSPGTAASRADLLNELNKNGFGLPQKVDLTHFADAAENILQSAPQLFELGAVEG